MIMMHQRTKRNFRTNSSNALAPTGSGVVRRAVYALVLVLSAGIPLLARMDLLTPRPDEFVRIDEFIVVVSVPAESRRVRLFFDEKEIGKLQRAAATVSFIPDAPFLEQAALEGPHRITIKRYGESSDIIEQLSMLVYLVREDTLTDMQRAAMVEKGKALTPVKQLKTPAPFHNGRLATWFENETYNETDRTVAEADAWGNGGIGKLKYDYNVTLRTDEQHTYQSLQRFRTAVAYGTVARLSMGDNWPAYHQSILRQQRVRGLELSLATPQKEVGLDVVWGEAQRAVEPFSVNPDALAASSAHNDSVAAFTAGTYERTLTALRLSCDIQRLFTASITLCKAIDDTTSIDQLTLIDTAAGDTVVTGRTPMDNLVYGADARLKLFRGKTELYGSFAMSWLTKDISSGPLSEEALGDFLDPDAKIFKPKYISQLLIVNETTEPLPLPTDSGDVVNMNSLLGAMNWDAGMRLSLPFLGNRTRTELKYYFVGPGYASLGNPFMLTDRAGWLLNTETQLLGGKCFVKAKVNWYDKDLFGVTGTPTQVLHTSVSTMVTVQQNLPTLMLMGALSDEQARTSYAVDPDRQNTYYTLGGSLQYTPRINFVTPSMSVAYYNTETSIESKNLSTPFSMRSHTAVANVSAHIEEVNVEPCAAFSINAATDDVPLTVLSVSAGTRWHIVPKVCMADILFGYAATDEPQNEDRGDVSFKAGGRYELTDRNTLWLDTGCKWSLEEKRLDTRFKFNYELRY